MPLNSFDGFKEGVQRGLREYLDGKAETGLSDVKRELARRRFPDGLVSNGLFVAKMLNAVGWRRDGFLYTGYDRTPRYAPQ